MGENQRISTHLYRFCVGKVTASLWLHSGFIVASLWLVVASLWLHCGFIVAGCGFIVAGCGFIVASLWLHCGLALSLWPSCNMVYNLTTRRLLSNNSFYNAVPVLEANAPTDIVAAIKLT